MSPPPKRHHIRRASIWLVLVCAIWLSACATGPNLGARGGYEGTTIPTVAVAPMYTASDFGTPRTHTDNLLALAEISAVEALDTYGFDVHPPGDVTSALDASDKLQDYRDGILLRDDLEHHFEPDRQTGGARLESARLIELSDTLPSRYILFGQLIYHTSTTCRVEPSEHQPLATVEPDGVALPSPCAISHVAFKLLDATTGETMWFNKVYLETRGEGGDRLARQNLSRAVANALVGPRGLPAYFTPNRAIPGR